MTGTSVVSGEWVAEGRRLGDKLGDYSAIVVLGEDATETASVAVGLAESQHARRRVAVADLFGEAPPLRELLSSDDPHGIVDSFLYGVSLNKIAQLVPGSEQLFVLPTGTDTPDYEELLVNPRWRRLAGGFREMGALFIVVAPASAPRVEHLVAAMDGAVLVGDAVPPQLPVSAVIASVHAKVVAPPPPVAPAIPARAARPALVAPKERGSRRRDAVVGGLVAVVVVFTVGWLAMRPRSFLPDNSGKARQPAPAASRGNVAVKFDSAAARISSDGTAIADPADSAIADVFAVQLMAANTRSGAILRLQQAGSRLPAATFAPVLEDGAEWSQVIAGAFTDSLSADSLLTRLRRDQLVDASHGIVVRVPFAFLIDSGVKAEAVDGMVTEFASRGQPVYALRQPDGSAMLFAGAFATPEQASLYAQSLRASGVTPVLEYRHGRQF